MTPVQWSDHLGGQAGIVLPSAVRFVYIIHAYCSPKTPLPPAPLCRRGPSTPGTYLSISATVYLGYNQRKTAKEQKGKGKTPANGEDGATSTEAQPEPTSPGDGVGPLILANNISEGGAGAGASGTDIVFVHGLRGARVRIWSKNGVCWPNHLLPNDLENVRVITWGYDANIANVFNAASKESIFDHADTLLDDLARLRIGITRPIVFVCHSLGGLVVKEALIKADNYKNHSRHPTLGALFVHTAGVIFMGTPHRGSSMESYGDLLVKVTKVALRQPNDQLLQTLRPDSHILENQRDQFTTILSRIPVVVPETSASYDGFNVRRGAIYANHMDMVKFASSSDPGYERTLGFIAELCNARQAVQQGMSESLQKRSNEILEILRFSSIDERELHIEEAYADTCAWIMDDTASAGTSDPRTRQFKPWLKDRESAFWISGKAGCGKSTLMKFIFQHQDTKGALTQWAGNKKLIMAGYFFMERGDNMQKSREGMIRSVLYQILGKRRDLIPVAFPTLFGDIPPLPETVNGWKSLGTAFDAMLGGLTDSKVCLFIDGLDEYRMIDKKDEYTQEQLDHIFDGAKEDESWGLTDWIVDGHKEIADFVLRISDKPNAKICFSSRELGVFEQRFSRLPRVEVHHYTAGSVRGYCEGRLGKEAPDLGNRSNFISSIVEKSRGVFLWVRLVVDMLVDGTAAGDTLPELWKILESLSTRLGGKNGLYMRMMQSVKKSHLPEAEKLFQLVMHWNARFSDSEAADIDIITLFLAQEGHLETDGGGGLRAKREKIAPETWEGLRSCRAGLQRRLKSRCGGLLEGAECVQFMHQTAKEFMSREYLWNLIFPKPKGFVPGPAKDLALLSGLVRRLKCCQEATLQTGSRRSTKSIIPHEMPCILLYQSFKVAEVLDKVGEAVDDYYELMDELDATGDHLTTPQWTNTTAQSRSNWIGFFVRARGQIFTERISQLDFMILLGCHRYAIAKIADQRIPQPQLNELLGIASRSIPLAWTYRRARRLRRIPHFAAMEVLLAAGADPNSKLKGSDDPKSPSEAQTPWTGFLRDLNPQSVRTRTQNLAIIQQFLVSGADRMAKFQPRWGLDMIITAEDAIVSIARRFREDDPNCKFPPDIVAIIEGKL